MGLGWMNRPYLKPVLEKELGVLQNLGVTDLVVPGIGGSDHNSFDRAGVPGCIFSQEHAGYQFVHHSQADMFDMAREPDLIQGAEVMAVLARHIANMDSLLPREAPKATAQK
jgi:hypothetical protein